MTWDPHLRLATIACPPGFMATGDNSRFIVQNLSNWTGADAEPFAVLGSGLAGESAESRALWTAFIAQHRDRIRVAVADAGPLMRAVVNMYALGARYPIRAFDSVEQARAWLLQTAPPPSLPLG
jgi:hypothetical protein